MRLPASLLARNLANPCLSCVPKAKVATGLKSFLYHWKAIEAFISKMGPHDPFGHLKHKLWPKERTGIKLAI
jgi:hypothetical protein